MTIAELLNQAAIVRHETRRLRENVQMAATVMGSDDLARVRAVLEEVHADNEDLHGELDAALKKAGG